MHGVDNMKKLLILTIGFDEKFPLRAVMRRGVSPGDVVLLVTASPIEERVKKAINMFRRMMLNVAKDVDIQILELPVENPVESIRLIRRKVDEVKADKVELNLSGGMRILLLEVLLALSPLRLDIPVEMELENGRAIVEIDLKWFRATAPNYEEMEIMKAVKERQPATLDMLVKYFTIKENETKYMKYPRSTLHRKLSKLVNAGFLEVERRGRKVYYKLSRLGATYV